jgi:putative membrane protein
MSTPQTSQASQNQPSLHQQTLALSDDSLLKSLNEKSLTLIIYAVSLVICLAVAFLIYFPQTLSIAGGVNVSSLPTFNAFLNGSVAVLLAVGYVAVRQKRYKTHKTLMVAAFILSSLFLVSYVVYHSQAPATKFGGEGAVRLLYFAILLTHIPLAALILPLALFTISRSWRGEFAKHKKIARWTLPLWLYVAVSGVVVYLMISPYYKH